MPYKVWFGPIYGAKTLLSTGVDQKTRRCTTITFASSGRIFEQKLDDMLEDTTTEKPFSCISDVCSLYISPLVRLRLRSERPALELSHSGTNHQEIVRVFLEKWVSDPDLEYVRDTIRDSGSESRIADECAKLVWCSDR
jgi:hypothetical protein